MVFLWDKIESEQVRFPKGFFNSILGRPIILLLLFSLTVLNWYFDTWAWRSISLAKEKLEFKQAIKDNLISQYLGLLTPFGLGEYRMKMRSFEGKERNQSVVQTLSYRWAKSISKFGIGLVAFSFYGWSKQGHLVIIILVWVAYILMFRYYKKVLAFGVNLINPSNSYEIDLDLIDIKKALLPGALKFVCYILQLSVLIHLFQDQLSFGETTLYSTLIYAASSLIPQASFLDPFIKATLANYLFLEVIDQSVLFASLFVVWMINSGIPAIFGAVLWFSPKKKKTL
jgi:hypothetical protein